eukprot:CAMPEP_0180627698 /NCGR_PEP_ID=MMETSP1037_2-20121125/38512_1 /TAXON_ID=632150 /ORGANISM="Azadinium spinosum, Strain 3D9" /LENGTH=162 /DNA_ID=CAMNT_0022648341 /DNA_START=340 /DNA_END=828 /DNA_ORIENTATION=-
MSSKKNAGTAERPTAVIFVEIVAASHLTIPYLFNNALMLTRIANHVIVVQAPFSPAQSSQLSVPVTSSTTKPSTAVDTAGIPKKVDPAHKTSMPRIVLPRIASSRDMGPISSSFLCASLGASGVAFTSGGSALKATSGVRAMATKAGTDIAESQAMKGDVIS